MTIAYNYARFSTKQQADGNSLERQTQTYLRACERNGWTPAEQMIAAGVSGFEGWNARPGTALARWLSKVEAGELRGSVLVVEDFDRLSRDYLTKAMTMVLRIFAGGVSIFTARDGYHGTLWNEEKINAEPGLLQSMAEKMSSANGYSVRQSWRLAEAWQSKREAMRAQLNSGIIPDAMTKKMPFWLGVSADKKFYLKPAETALVRQMFQYYADGYGTTQIARHLTEQGFRKPRGKLWTDVAVLDVVSNPSVIGILEHSKASGGGIQAGYYPVAVNVDVFNRCQIMRTKNLKKGGKKGKTQKNLFSGLVYCGECGGKLRLNTDHRNEKYSRFACRRQMAGGCNFQSMRYCDFETELLELIFNKINVEALKTGRPPVSEKTTIQMELTGLIDEQTEIMDSLRIKKKLPEVLLNRLSELEAEIAHLNEKLRKMLPEIDQKSEWKSAANTYWTMFLPNTTNVDFRIKLASELKFIISKMVIGRQHEANRPVHVFGFGWEDFLLIESAPMRAPQFKKEKTIIDGGMVSIE